MKNRRLLPLLVGATLISAFGFGTLPSVSAQPAGAAPKAGKKGRAKGTKGGVPKKMMGKIEEQLGKPLTEDQKSKLNAAYKVRTDAQKAAQAKFLDEVTTVTGLTADQVAALNKRAPGAGGKAGAKAGAGKMAPA